MKNKEELKQFSISIVQKLQSADFEAYFAGGCVRDHVLGIPSKDYDVTTNALPDELRKIFPRTVPVGEAFNVILVLSEEEKNPMQVEVATFRSDLGIADGRHPQAIKIATAREDVERRDFTINGMLYDPLQNKIFDWVGGQTDLKNKIIRSIGNPELRIEEDHLRMLRAVRFSARFEYELEPTLVEAIFKKASLITKISAERIFEELTKILLSPHPDRAFNHLADLGLLQHILPEMLPMKGCEQPAEFHPEGDVWVHTLLLLKIMSEQKEESTPELAWSCLLHDIGKPPTFSHEPPDRIRFNNHQNVGALMAEKILRRLRASNDFIEVVSELVRDHLKFKDAPQMRGATLKRFLRNPNFQLHLRLHYIDCMACHQDLKMFHFCEQKLKEIGTEKLRPPSLLSGHDLIRLGYTPGPLFKKILETIETEQLEGRLQTKDDALQFVKTTFQ